MDNRHHSALLTSTFQAVGSGMLSDLLLGKINTVSFVRSRVMYTGQHPKNYMTVLTEAIAHGQKTREGGTRASQHFCQGRH